MDLNLKDRVALVTGAAGGLGLAISEVLAGEGAHVLMHDRCEESVIRTLADRLAQSYGVRCVPCQGDITRPDDVDRTLALGLQQFGRLDILVNNAGTWPTAYVKDMADEDWEQTIKINLTAPFYFSKRVVRHWLDSRQRGTIVNIVSQAAFHGSTSGHAHYAAAKGGLVTFTVSLAREVARHGIRVNAVAPGMARTGMNREALAAREAEYVERIPLGRIAEPREIAYAVTFLASDKADYITGATLDVTGGMLMR